VYPFSRVGSNPLWAGGGRFFDPFTERSAPFCPPACPQRDTLTVLLLVICCLVPLAALAAVLYLAAPVWLVAPAGLLALVLLARRLMALLALDD